MALSKDRHLGRYFHHDGGVIKPSTLAAVESLPDGQVQPVTDKRCNNLYVRDGSLIPATAVITTSALSMRVNPISGISPPVGTVITSQDEYDALGYDLLYPQDAIDILPPVLSDSVKVLMAAGTYLGKPGNFGFGLTVALNLKGRDFDIAGEFYGVDPDTLYLKNAILFKGEDHIIIEAEQGGVISDNYVLTRNVGSWVVGEHEGKWVCIKTGVGAGTRLLIQNNDAATITFQGTSSNGACTFEIGEPAAIWLDSPDGLVGGSGMMLQGPANFNFLLFDNIQFGTDVLPINGLSFMAAAYAQVNFCSFRLISFGFLANISYGLFWLNNTFVEADGSYPILCTDDGNLGLQKARIKGRITTGSTFYKGLILIVSGGRLMVQSGASIAALNSGYSKALLDLKLGVMDTDRLVCDGNGSSCVGLTIGSKGVGSVFSNRTGLDFKNIGIAIESTDGGCVSLQGPLSGSNVETGFKLARGAFVTSLENPSGIVATNDIDIDGDVVGYSEIPNPGDFIEGKNGSRLIR